MRSIFDSPLVSLYFFVFVYVRIRDLLSLPDTERDEPNLDSQRRCIANCGSSLDCESHF